MNIPFVVETVLHDGLLKYKFKNSKIRSITTKPGKSKGAIFAYRSKKSMIGGRGVVLTSEEAIHENQDTFTHWTPNVYRYGTYADENRSYTKGHSENNLRQINTFFIDFDIHTEKETISASDILTTHSGSFFLQICKLKGIYKFSKLLYTPQDLFFIYKEIYYGKNHY